MSLPSRLRPLRAPLTLVHDVSAHHRGLSRLTGRANQETLAEEAGSRTAEEQSQPGGNASASLGSQHASKRRGSSPGRFGLASDSSSAQKQPRGTFTWLNRHRSSAAEARALRTEHDSSSAQQPRQQPDKAQKHAHAKAQPLNRERAKGQDRTGRSDKVQQPASAAPEANASADRQAQLQKRWQMEQANADYRAFKSTDASWQPEKSLWKTQNEEPKGSSRDGNRNKGNGSATTASTSEAESGQSGQPAQDRSAQGQAPPASAAASSASQASRPQPPRLRWLAIGKNSATSAPAAAQPAGQQSQTEAASKAADPSRWLSKGAMDTLRWQAKMSEFNDSKSVWAKAKEKYESSVEMVMKRDWRELTRSAHLSKPGPLDSQAGQGTAAQREYAEWLRQAKGERRTSREYGVRGGGPARPQPRGEPGFWEQASAAGARQQRQQQQPWPQEQQQQQQQQQLNGMQRQEHMLRQGAPAQQQQQQPGQRQPQPRAPERKAAFAPKPRAPKEIVLPQGVTAQQLAALLGCGMQRLEEVLADMGERVESEEDAVALDVAELAALELGQLAVRAPEAKDKEADAAPRPPVVTVMGHVDHGKTSLLDALRKTSVAAGEAGGITQHIGAFQVSLPGSQGTATFLDTPGHAAFSAMRARGAQVTDIVVLVVAANDGVMPQTREALSHAQAAGCPIILALTKCDMPGADPARVKNQLLSAGLLLEEAGGTVLAVETAAPTGQGLAALEEAILLQAELMDLKATQGGPAEGTTVEARQAKGQGPVATVIVKRGALRIGDNVAVGTEWGRIRSMQTPAGALIKEALPGQPVEITGLRSVPQAGDDLIVVPSEERARRISGARSERAEDYRFSRMAHAARQQLEQREAAEAAAAEAGEAGLAQRPEVAVLVKADVQGSAEAVRDAVRALASEAVGVKVVSMGIGPVSAFDVKEASAVGADIIAFNVRTAGAEVDNMLKAGGVNVMAHRVIYSLLDEVVERMTGAAPRVAQQKVVGEAQVLQVFEMQGRRADAKTAVAGCRIAEGSIRTGCTIKVLRGGDLIHEGPMASLKRQRLDVERVGKGTECGVALEGFGAFQPGDVLQCIELEMVAPKLDSIAAQRPAQHG